MLLAGCTKVGGDATPGAPSGGTLRVAIQREPETLNPILPATTTEAFLDRLSFDTLTTIDASGKTTIPILATEVPTEANGGISADGKTIIYHLHSGVKWQDGAPFSSRDVKFTWQQVMNNANNVNTHNGYDRIASVDAPNDTTVVFHLKARYAPFINTVFGESDNTFGILPEHLLAKYPNLNHISFNQLPVGTGPFKVVRWTRGDRIEYVANDDYFRGKPKLRRIVVREIPDENTEINALRTHDVDWMFEASPETINELRPIAADGTIKLLLFDQPNTQRIWINTSDPVLRDVRVRQAIATIVDKKLLVDRLTGGTAIPGTADQPPYSPYYEPNVTIYHPDPARAKALLVAAGYAYGADGIPRKNGRPLSLQLSYNVENVTRRSTAIQVQAMLKSIGIDAPIKTYPANLMFATFGQGGILTNAKYQINVSGWVAGSDPDDYSLYGCDEFPPNGSNYSRYCSQQMQASQRQALGSYDPAVRKPAYAQIQKQLARDLPDIVLWYPRQIQPINPAFKNFTPNPVQEAWNAFMWEI